MRGGLPGDRGPVRGAGRRALPAMGAGGRPERCSDLLPRRLATSGEYVSIRFEDSRALVTGATGGIGRAVAHALHARGATVVLTGRRVDVLDEIARELGDRVEVVGADLANAPDVERLGERRDVDVLVANAALPAAGRLQTFSAHDLDRAIDVNVRAPMQLTLALLPGMLERGSGHLVYVSSLAGKVASAG